MKKRGKAVGGSARRWRRARAVVAKRAKVRTPARRQRQGSKLALLKRELDEALERQAATAEVLRVISASPGDLEPVFQAMLENATRICAGQVRHVLRCTTASACHAPRAMHNAPRPSSSMERQRGRSSSAGRHRASTACCGRRRVVHIADATKERLIAGRSTVRPTSPKLAAHAQLVACRCSRTTS